jgi:hypothetical protein
MGIARGLFTLVLLAGIGWASFGLGQEPTGFAGNNVTSLIKVDLTGVNDELLTPAAFYGVQRK